MNIVRKHIYWMSMKEYKKWSKNKNNIFSDKITTRTHIYFT